MRGDLGEVSHLNTLGTQSYRYPLELRPVLTCETSCRLADTVLFESSRLPSSTPLSASTLPDAARQILLQSAFRPESRSASRQSVRGDERDGGSDRALRFGGIWNKLDRGVGRFSCPWLYA